MPNELTRSEQLLLKAESGEQLNVDERRVAVGHLMATRPDLSNMDLGKLFGVSDTMIRKDKDWLRKQTADEIVKDDISLVIGDIRRTYERFVVEVEKSTKKCAEGTNTKLAHLKAGMDYQLKVVEALQSLGYYPKNLGNMTKKTFVFKSHVSEKDGSVSTLPVIDAEFEDVKDAPVQVTPLLKDSPEEAAMRAALEEEFKETPREVSTPPSGA
jgi:hypothetical protein